MCPSLEEGIVSVIDKRNLVAAYALFSIEMMNVVIVVALILRLCLLARLTFIPLLKREPLAKFWGHHSSNVCKSA